MLAMSPLFPNLGWEYPMEIGAQQANLDNWNFDPMFLPNYSTCQAQVDQEDQEQDVKRSESPQSASSADHFCATVLAKKINHNASERDRRKKINQLYSSLRALLPATDHTKKLSIPATVARVLKYIPELQKEVQDLLQKKEELLSKFSVLQVASTVEYVEDEKPVIKNTIEEKPFCTISANKLGNREMVIQISTYHNISLPGVLLLLEKTGLCVLDVSSSRSFGGSTFYNIHLWIEGTNHIKCEKLKEELLSLIQKQKQVYF